MPQMRIRDRKVDHGLLVRTTLGAVLAAAVVCANTAARAGDDGDGPTVIGQIMNSLGFKNANSGYDGIQYTERSPLVVPPTRDLPPPAKVNVTPAPNWPKDADLERRNKERAESKKRVPQKDYLVESSRPLRPDELDKPGRPGPNASGGGDSTADSQQADPRDLGAKKSLFSNIFKKEEYAPFTGEPTRDALTDPPPGYLTPSPDQPYGVGSQKKAYKVDTAADHGTPTR
jgi:hypothetical protein